MKNLKFTLGWLYPELMSTYGDRGNVFCLKKRCEWRGIDFEVVPIDQNTKIADLKRITMIFGGGSQDRQQEIVMRDLKDKKDDIKALIENNIPALFVCGSPQLMGKYYEPSVGQRIDGVGVFDMVSKHPGKGAKRCIGNIVAEVNLNELRVSNDELRIEADLQQNRKQNNNVTRHSSFVTHNYIVGFENHGGRTYLGQGVRPFAKVIKGYGNNGEDGTEGVVYKNAIGCYFHGPLLPKNPHIADWIVGKSLEVACGNFEPLKMLDDTLEWKAHTFMVARLAPNLVE